MDAKTIILGFLSCKSLTGYELRRFFSISFSFFSGMSYGSIYPSLRRLEREGLVTMSLRRGKGAPDSKLYTITPAGRRAFREALLLPLPVERFRSPFLMRLFFFAGLTPAERGEIVAGFLAAVRLLHRELVKLEPEIKANADFFQHQCFLFGVRFFRDLTRNVAAVQRALAQEATRTR